MMGSRWSAIPDRVATVDDEEYVLVSEEEAKHLIDERELFVLLRMVEELSGGEMSVISTDVFVDEGEASEVWAVIANIFSDLAFDENVAWGTGIIETLRELLKVMQRQSTDYEEMDAEQIADEARGIRDGLEQGYIAWRNDNVSPEKEVAELWEFRAESRTPEVIAVGGGETEAEALRNLLIGLRDRKA